MPNISIYIKNRIWTRIVKEHGGDDLKARRWVKQLVEGRYGKKATKTT